MQGQLWIVAAPSGGGKTSLIAEIVRRLPNVVESISYTTRPRRLGEVDGQHYFFVSPEEFDTMRMQGEFLESAQVFQYSYGTSKAHINHLLAQGNDVVLSIDWQGANKVRQCCSSVKSVYLLPPNMEVLRTRLEYRGQDSADSVAHRMAEAEEQISHYCDFDYIIINDDFNRAATELQMIIQASRLTLVRQQEDLRSLLRTLGQHL